MHEPFTRAQPTWSASRSNTFGYSVATVYNATHLHWQQVQTDPSLFPDSDYGRIIDDAWIVQHSHGPFDAAKAPLGEACKNAPDCGERQYDHWWPILGFEDNSGRPSDEILRDLHRKNGKDWWVKTMSGLMDLANRKLGGDNTTWR